MLSFSYRKICAFLESSNGAARQTATMAANAIRNFMMISFCLVDAMCWLKVWNCTNEVKSQDLPIYTARGTHVYTASLSVNLDERNNKSAASYLLNFIIGRQEKNIPSCNGSDTLSRALFLLLRLDSGLDSVWLHSHVNEEDGQKRPKLLVWRYSKEE